MKDTCKADLVYLQDSPREMEEVQQLLGANKLALDPGVELFVLCRHEGRLIACAGLEHKTVKCVAIDERWRSESLGLGLATEIRRLAAERRVFHLFLYSAPHTLEFFRGWGFYPLVEAPQLIVLMESSPVAIKAYCDGLRQHRRPGKKIGGVVLNADPFTLGHQYLVERASQECDWLHVFVGREDAAFLSYADRYQLVLRGIEHVQNLTLHHGSDYTISRTTFPRYFLKDQTMIDYGWSAIDVLLFREYIGPALGITHRYVGTEPFSRAMGTYNSEMKIWLQQAGPTAPIKVVEIPRAAVAGTAICASDVRRSLTARDLTLLEQFVPPTTSQFLERKFARSTRAQCARHWQEVLSVETASHRLRRDDYGMRAGGVCSAPETAIHSQA
jgi:[citrate (pro-3S)-lyase] ligase